MPSEEVHEIIDKLCRANEFSQSKVTGLLVEEALRSRGVLSDTFNQKTTNNGKFINDSFQQEQLSINKQSPASRDIYSVNRKEFYEDIKMMHEYIEFKHFKRVMKQNNDIVN